MTARAKKKKKNWRKEKYANKFLLTGQNKYRLSSLNLANNYTMKYLSWQKNLSILLCWFIEILFFFSNLFNIPSGPLDEKKKKIEDLLEDGLKFRAAKGDNNA